MSLPKNCIATEKVAFAPSTAGLLHPGQARRYQSRRICGFAASLLGMLFASSAYAVVAGSVSNLSGPLLAQKADGSVKILSQKSEVEEGDTLISEKGTYARIKFIDNSEVTLRPNTQFKITNFAFDENRPQQDNAVFSLIKGGLRSITGLLGKRSKERYGLNTPTATIGIRGTTFIAQYISPDEIVETPQQAAYTAASVAWLSGDERQAFGVSDMPAPQLTPLPPKSETMQLAQFGVPGAGGALAPGLYVHVIDGLIQLSNRGGVQQFAAGQFGFTGSVVQPPVIVPNNPGIQFNPPPAFQSTNTGSKAGGDEKPKGVDCEVR